MKLVFGIILILLSLCSIAQESEESQILALRAKSNAALRAFDEELNATFLTDGILITTGAGTLISGKNELLEYIRKASGPRMYWIRTPDEIIVNPETQLAWESGTWKGIVEGSEEPVVGGNYAAQWTKKSGQWLIQSELFVALPIYK
ncbi:hypothetical protein SAMN04488519_103175 [Algoriphagus ornithinivorans]|uniref:DUF4440 domain-containing protein n=1 Tax=Algoriphagus ornithinivorans TaxID=226506 RepID=A0A1I5DWC8_9BACT|nr:nuclear transport factor 2 family protein [Algoriphagus ornithinivorans]SFO03508.1 hypothetical protein SAMN04488519_103175 [Algoriphagus ornithinivorans]